MAGDYLEMLTKCEKCGYWYARAEQEKCPHKFRDKRSQQLMGQDKKGWKRKL